jgi:hypothetical protein
MDFTYISLDNIESFHYKAIYMFSFDMKRI